MKKRLTQSSLNGAWTELGNRNYLKTRSEKTKKTRDIRSNKSASNFEMDLRKNRPNHQSTCLDYKIILGEIFVMFEIVM